MKPRLSLKWKEHQKDCNWAFNTTISHHLDLLYIVTMPLILRLFLTQLISWFLIVFIQRFLSIKSSPFFSSSERLCKGSFQYKCKQDLAQVTEHYPEAVCTLPHSIVASAVWSPGEDDRLSDAYWPTKHLTCQPCVLLMKCIEYHQTLLKSSCIEYHQISPKSFKYNRIPWQIVQFHLAPPETIK